MKILLIMPDAQMHKLIIGSHVRSFREAPLTLTSLAALANDPRIEYTLVDESVDVVPLDHPADLVGISLLTGTAKRGYALADHFRRRGARVVLGGVHVTLLPDEARAHADAIVVGMAEESWPALVEDLLAGRALKRVYSPSTRRVSTALLPWLQGIPTPRWELQRESGYVVPYVVQVTRGCRHACDFCSVPAVWRRYQRRPVADVIRDIQRIPARRFVISDVSPFEDVEYAKELLRAMIPLEKTWGALATTQITQDAELFDLLVRSGCRYLLIGFESMSEANLRQIGKGFNRSSEYADLMHQLHAAKISVQGCFVFGFDHDGPEVFDETVERVRELKIDIPRYSIYTPYPGTRLFERLEAEGRILSYDWSEYDTMHVVFRPAQMSPVALYRGFCRAYEETFRYGAIVRRAALGGGRFPITLVGNMVYRIFSNKLRRGRGFEISAWGASKVDARRDVASVGG